MLHLVVDTCPVLGRVICVLRFGGVKEEPGSRNILSTLPVLPTDTLCPEQQRRFGCGYRPPADRLGDVDLTIRVNQLDLNMQLKSRIPMA